MLELLEKAVLTGLGAIALSQRKGEELVTELKEKYRLSEEEGKAFLERLQGLAKDGRERVTELAESEVKKVIDRIGLVSRDEFDMLQKRVDELEKKVKGEAADTSC